MGALRGKFLHKKTWGNFSTLKNDLKKNHYEAFDKKLHKTSGKEH